LTASLIESERSQCKVIAFGSEPLSASHCHALDGLRGIAIVLVVCCHSNMAIDGSNVFERYWLGLSSVGWCGVDLFFVLSGFLISGILLDSRGKRYYFRNFYARRTLRIFPLYYAALTIYSLCRPPFDGWLLHWIYLQNWITVLSEAVPPLMLQPMWSLGVEEQFYLICPLVVYALDRRRLAQLFGLVFVAVFVGRCVARWQGVDPLTIYFNTLFRVDTFALGILLAIAVRDRRLRAYVQRIRGPVFWFAVAGLAWVGVADGGFSWLGRWNQTVGYTLLAVLGAVAIATAMDHRAARKPFRVLLESPVLRYLGNRSYAIYVFHMACILILKAYYRIRWQAADKDGVLDVLAYMTAVLLCVALAEMSWRCFERPILSLKRYFPRYGESF